MSKTEHEFKAGDVVRLRTDGPDMVIESIGKERLSSTKDGAWCVRELGGQQKREFFEFAAICPADSKPMDKKTVEYIRQALQYCAEHHGSIDIPLSPAKAVTSTQGLVDQLNRWLES
jgi:hypothetical protein